MIRIAVLAAVACACVDTAVAQTNVALAQVRVPPMPNVVGLTRDSAQTVLSGRQPQVTFTTRPVRADSVGLVLSQYPAAGSRVHPDSIVLVVGQPLRRTAIATRPVFPPRDSGTTVPLTAVPQLAGRDSNEWPARLKSARLSVGTIHREVSTEQPAGLVVRTEPIADDSVPLRTPVSLFVSLGAPEPEPKPEDVIPDPPPVVVPIVMPSVLGHTAQQAFGALDAAGFSAISLTGASSAGAVVEAQMPIAGRSTLPGVPVTLAMVAPVQRIVPSLLDSTFEEAQLAVASLDFVVVLSGTRRAWRLTTVVESQAPAAGPIPADAPNTIVVALVAPFLPPAALFVIVIAGVTLAIALWPSPSVPHPTAPPAPPAPPPPPPPPGITARMLPGRAADVALDRSDQPLVASTLSIRFSTTMSAPGVDCAEESILRITRWSDER